MGSKLARIIIEGGVEGENEHGSKFLLSDAPPQQRILASVSENGMSQHEHQKELQRQMEQVLEGPGLFLFNDFTHYFGGHDAPTVGIRTYLEYKSILP